MHKQESHGDITFPSSRPSPIYVTIALYVAVSILALCPTAVRAQEAEPTAVAAETVGTEAPSPAQQKVLEAKGLWVAGMTKAEANELIAGLR